MQLQLHISTHSNDLISYSHDADITNGSIAMSSGCCHGHPGMADP